jgi:hypothetical protein
MKRLKRFIDNYFEMIVKIIFLIAALSCAIMLIAFSIEYLKTV